MIMSTQKVARAVKKALDAPSICLVQLNGAPAGQSFFHVHFHVIPRDVGVGLESRMRKAWSMRKILEAVAVRIGGAM